MKPAEAIMLVWAGLATLAGFLEIVMLVMGGASDPLANPKVSVLLVVSVVLTLTTAIVVVAEAKAKNAEVGGVAITEVLKNVHSELAMMRAEMDFDVRKKSPRGA